MDRQRWSHATEIARPSRLFSIEAWCALAGLAAGAILTASLSHLGYLGIGLGAVGGGVIGYVLSFAATWIVTFLKYPRVQLELRVAQLEVERRVATPAATAGPAPNIRPFVVAADEMLAQETGNEEAVTKWVDDVYKMLFDWDVTVAHQFRPIEMVPTRGSLALRNAWLASPEANPRPPLRAALAMLSNPIFPPTGPSLQYDPQLMRLKRFRDRLLELDPK